MNHIKTMLCGNSSVDKNEAIFQLMMLAYNLFCCSRWTSLGKQNTGSNQDVPMKYKFLAGKIIRTARSVVMQLSEKYPYREMYEKSLS